MYLERLEKLKKLIKISLIAAITWPVAGLSSAAYGEPADWESFYLADRDRRAHQIAVAEDRALGVDRFDLDEHTEIIGWQIGDRWYFGRQDGLDSGLTLVWQAEANQVSLSKDGVRLTRRF